MTRKLTQEEEDLWSRVMSGAETISCPTATPETPRRKIVIRDHSFQKTIDLHGLYLNDAYKKTREYFDRAYENGEKTVTVITGRSGNILEEFPHWANSHSKVRRIELKPNKGSWKVWLEKKSSI